ncbi:MAG: outer membrane beta-barrel protein, partial [Bacteroidota bacterium]
MKKVISVITFLMLFGSMTFGQANFRFGFQLSPNISWLSSDDNTINGNGSNLGLKLGMMGEKYLTDSENYAFTFGIGFAFNQGGTLKHDTGGNFWPKSELSSELFRSLPDGINLKYGIQFVEIPLGFKMRTQEFGYFRYFAEPGLTLGFGTQARGAVSGVTGFSTENENI